MNSSICKDTKWLFMEFLVQLFASKYFRYSKIIGFLWIAASLFVLCKGVIWLVIGMILTFLSGVLWQQPFAKKLSRNSRFYGPAYMLIAFTTAVLIKVFVLEICIIPSESMESTLLPGDVLLINKLAYGPRLPRSVAETPWINGLYFFLQGRDAYGRSMEMGRKRSFKRWKGFTQVKRNDVVIFDSPIRSNTLLVKRFLALPGDTIEIRSGQFFVNGELQILPSSGKAAFQLCSEFSEQVEQLFQKQGIKSRKEEEGVWKVVATGRQYEQFKESGYFDSLEVIQDQKGVVKRLWHERQDWNSYDFGPVVLPATGLKISLDSIHIQVYGKLIERYEGKKVLPGQVYVFRNNYYFAMGDNRPNSFDSRYWGFIPEGYIMGKAGLVLFSKGK